MHALLSLFRFLPLPLRPPLAALMATLAYGVDRRRVKIFNEYWSSCAVYLFKAKPAAPRQVHAWRAAYFHALALLDFFAVMHEPPEVFLRTFELHHSELLAPRPLILFAPHFVGLSLLTRVLAYTHQINFLYSPSKNPAIARWMKERYAELSNGRAFTKNQSILPLARALKKGERVQLSTDLDVGGRDTLFVPFCGRLAATSPAIPLFAEKFSVPVVGVYCIMLTHSWWTLIRASLQRKPLIRYRIIVENIALNGDSPLANQTLMHEWLEQIIVAHPEQYWWFHRRFKTSAPIPSSHSG